jgi:CENP-B N-terminal DNA-binding domain
LGSKIPKPIKIEVIRKWLQGKSRDQIANEVQIGAGTVSGIVKEYRRDDPEIDLLREVGLNLINRGMKVESFSALIRLREVLEEKKWLLDVRPGEDEERGGGGGEDDIYDLDQVSEKKMESLIVSLEVFCFKQNLSIKQFFDSIYKMYWAADKLDIPLENFPEYIEQLKVKKDNLIDQIQQLESEKQISLESYHTTKEGLEEYRNDRPLFEKNQQLKQELQKAKQERDRYKIELEQMRIWKRKEEQMMWQIPEEELYRAREDLNYSKQMLSPENLKKIVMDVYSHPSKTLK